MLKCIIKENEYTIDDGAVFIENYNETLDSGTIIISQLKNKIDIKPYDIVVINSEANDGLQINEKRMCVDSYTCTQTSFNPPIYKYEITLFSETKQLEGILCPSIAITNTSGKTLHTIYDYLNLYLLIYGTKTQSSETSGLYGDKFRLGNSLISFGLIECPEMQWNEPTLREVFTDLMMVSNSIPVVRNNVIECINIGNTDIDIEANNNPNKAVQLAGLNYITESQSSDDFVSEIKMRLVNTANNSDGAIDSTAIVEKIGFRNDESYLLTVDNMRVQTSLPIWKMFSAKVYLKVTIEYDYRKYNGDVVVEDGAFSVTGDVSFDLTNYILEYGEWLTKDVFYGQWQTGTDDHLDTNYRNKCLYFKRGEKNIYNFNDKIEYNVLFIEDTMYVWELIIREIERSSAIQELAEQDLAERQAQEPVYTYEFRGVSSWTFVDDNNDATSKTYPYAKFEVEYEPLDEFTFRVSKSPFQRNKRQIIDHQTNSYIDINRQGLLEYMKANRLGNEMALINARYQVNESYIPRLAQTYKGKVIFRKEMSVYHDHLDLNYLATENYVLRNYFTGVKSKLRSWRIVSGSEALKRNELIKFYSNSDLQAEYNTKIANEYRIIPVYSTTDLYLEHFKYCAIQFRDDFALYDTPDRDDIYPPRTAYGLTSHDTNAIAVEFSKHKAGNSVIFTIDMNDNCYAGNYVSNYDGYKHQVEQKGVKYTNDNGGVVGGFICFYSDYDFLSFGSEEVNRALKPMVNVGYTNEPFEDRYYGPPKYTAHMVARIPFMFYKDNKEILQISIQFEINEEANDVFLGYKEEE